MATYETLLVDRPQAGITVATLNRPDRLNALSFQAFKELVPAQPGDRSRRSDPGPGTYWSRPRVLRGLGSGGRQHAARHDRHAIVA